MQGMHSSNKIKHLTKIFLFEKIIRISKIILVYVFAKELDWYFISNLVVGEANEWLRF